MSKLPDFLQETELKKTFSRFNKVRALHVQGWRNLLPFKYIEKKSNVYEQIQLNTPDFFNAIIIDMDKEDLLTEWNEIGLPTPTIQTVNKTNNKAHLVWLLNNPVYRGHQHSSDYYTAILDGIKRRLSGADKHYNNTSTKNFLNKELYRVTYNDVAYDLGDFREFIIQKQKKKKGPLNKAEARAIMEESRHMYLFHTLRWEAYRLVSDNDFEEKVKKIAEEINNGFLEPIKVKYIVKSIIRYCYKHKDSLPRSIGANYYKVGVMKFHKILPTTKEKYEKEVKSRQSRAATRTARIRGMKSIYKIKNSIHALAKRNKKLTYSAIAKHAKVSLSTVKRYFSILKIILKKHKGFNSYIKIIAEVAERSSARSEGRRVPCELPYNSAYFCNSFSRDGPS